LVNLCFLPAFLTQYRVLHRERVGWNRELVASFRSDIRGVLHYDRARPPWDNTILVSKDLIAYPLIAVPPGMGVNAVLVPETFVLPPRSRYVLMSEEETRDLERYFRLKPLARTPVGMLSINLDAARRDDGG